MTGIVIVIFSIALLVLCMKYYSDSKKWKMQKDDMDRQYKELLVQKKDVDAETERQIEKRAETEKQLEQKIEILLAKIRCSEEKIEEMEKGKKSIYDSAQNIHLYSQLLREECETASQMEVSDTVLKECEKILQLCQKQE